jgi:hypothetical protein
MKSPMLQPPAPRMPTYTFGSGFSGKSNLDRINEIINLSSSFPCNPPSASPLRPLPPPTGVMLPPELSLSELPRLPTAPDVLLSPPNFEDDFNFEDDWSKLEWDITPEDENEMIYPDFLQSLN